MILKSRHSSRRRLFQCLGNDGDSCFTLPGVRYGAILLVARFLGLIPPAAFSLDLDTARHGLRDTSTIPGTEAEARIIFCI